MGYKVAIDGPAGSGKSTISKIIAKNNQLLFVSTGYFYRAYAYLLNKYNLVDADWEKQKACLDEHEIDLKEDRLLIDNVDLTNEVKTLEISNLASSLAVRNEIREYSKISQQNIANKYDVIMDGRDIGTVIMPDANLKIYLTASISERTKRRIKELKELNQKVSWIKTWIQIYKRDYIDKHRKIAPLKKAKDAIKVNTDNKTIEQVVNEIQQYIKK